MAAAAAVVAFAVATAFAVAVVVVVVIAVTLQLARAATAATATATTTILLLLLLLHGGAELHQSAHRRLTQRAGAGARLAEPSQHARLAENMRATHRLHGLARCGALQADRARLVRRGR